MLDDGVLFLKLVLFVVSFRILKILRFLLHSKRFFLFVSRANIVTILWCTLFYPLGQRYFSSSTKFICGRNAFIIFREFCILLEWILLKRIKFYVNIVQLQYAWFPFIHFVVHSSHTHADGHIWRNVRFMDGFFSWLNSICQTEVVQLVFSWHMIFISLASIYCFNMHRIRQWLNRLFMNYIILINSKRTNKFKSTEFKPNEFKPTEFYGLYSLSWNFIIRIAELNFIASA